MSCGSVRCFPCLCKLLHPQRPRIVCLPRGSRFHRIRMHHGNFNVRTVAQRVSVGAIYLKKGPCLTPQDRMIPKGQRISSIESLFSGEHTILQSQSQRPWLLGAALASVTLSFGADPWACGLASQRYSVCSCSEWGSFAALTTGLPLLPGSPVSKNQSAIGTRELPILRRSVIFRALEHSNTCGISRVRKRHGRSALILRNGN